MKEWNVVIVRAISLPLAADAQVLGGGGVAMEIECGSA
jgi:hypothetical protein